LRKESENPDKKIIDFYATQTIKSSMDNYYMKEEKAQSPSEIENVIAGAAAEIRKKLANYNTHNFEDGNSSAKKSTSFNSNLRSKTKFESKRYLKSPKNYNVLYKNTLSSTRVFAPNVKNEVGIKQLPKSGRSSVNKHYRSIGRNETNSSKLRLYQGNHKMNTNYFTNGTMNSNVETKAD